MTNTDPTYTYERNDLRDTEPPTFPLDARDRHALGALKDYAQRVRGDGVASKGYVDTVDEVVNLFTGWQAANQHLVMSADQPYRSANEIDPAQADVVARRESIDQPRDDEPDALNPAPDASDRDLDSTDLSLAPDAPEGPTAGFGADEGTNTLATAPTDPASAQAAYEAQKAAEEQARAEQG